MNCPKCNIKNGNAGMYYDSNLPWQTLCAKCLNEYNDLYKFHPDVLEVAEIIYSLDLLCRDCGDKVDNWTWQVKREKFNEFINNKIGQGLDENTNGSK